MTLALSLFAATASNAQQQEPDLSSPLLRLGDEVVTLGDFLAANRSIRDFLAYRTVTRDELQRALEEFAMTRLLAREARAGNLDETPVVRAQLDAILGTAYLKTRLPHSVISVSQEDLETFYAAHRERFRRDRRAQVAHILTPSEADARAVRRQLDEGLSFEQAARDSLDPATAKHGGLLGWVSPKRLPAPLADAIQALEPGAISEPVETVFGHHLVKLIEWQPVVYRPLSEVQDAIHKRVVSDKEQAMLRSIRNELWQKYAPEFDIEVVGEYLVDDPQPMPETPRSTASGGGAPPSGPRFILLTNSFHPDLESADRSTLRVMVTNPGDAAVEVKEVHSTCQCITGNVVPGTIPPGGRGALTLTVRADGIDKNTRIRHRVAFETNDSEERLRMLEVITGPVVEPAPGGEQGKS